jgi:hypothetical protein
MYIWFAIHRKDEDSVRSLGIFHYVTDRTGYVVWEDEFQIVAEAFSDLAC